MTEERIEEIDEFQASGSGGSARVEVLSINLAEHKKQVMSAVEASTERRTSAANLVRNHMYYAQAEEEPQKSQLDQLNRQPTGQREPFSRKVLSEIQPQAAVVQELSKPRKQTAGRYNHLGKKRNRRNVFADEEEQASELKDMIVGESQNAQTENIPPLFEVCPFMDPEPKLEIDTSNSPVEKQNTEPILPLSSVITQPAEEEKHQKKPSKQECIFIQLGQVLEDNALIRFLTSPLSASQKMRCFIRRSKDGLKSSYELVSEGKRKMIGAYEQWGCIGVNYYLTLTKCNDKKSDGYLGKLRSDFSGSSYVLYSKGEKPNKDTPIHESRITLATIDYETNLLGLKGPRKIQVRIPNCNMNQQEFRLADGQTLQSQQLSRPGSTLLMKNRQPKWNHKIGSYALNFGGRIKMASIKNFILEYPKELSPQSHSQSQQNSMLFGKIDESTFSLELGYPLSPLQAFGIGLTSFDYKFNCQ